MTLAWLTIAVMVVVGYWLVLGPSGRDPILNHLVGNILVVAGLIGAGVLAIIHLTLLLGG